MTFFKQTKINSKQKIQGTLILKVHNYHLRLPLCVITAVRVITPTFLVLKLNFELWVDIV